MSLLSCCLLWILSGVTARSLGVHRRVGSEADLTAVKVLVHPSAGACLAGAFNCR